MKKQSAQAGKQAFSVERVIKDDGRVLYLYRLNKPGDDLSEPVARKREPGDFSPRRSRRGVPTAQNQPTGSGGFAIHGGVDTAATPVRSVAALRASAPSLQPQKKGGKK